MIRTMVMSCSTGTGHMMAAQGFIEEFRKRKHIKIQLIDCLDYMNSFSRWVYTQGWLEIAALMPKFYGGLFKALTHNFRPYPLLALKAHITLFKRIEKELRKHNPDIIICTHPVGVFMAVLWKRSNKNVFIMAQSIDFHAINTLAYSGVDMLCATTKEAKKLFVNWGIEENKILVIGPPVRQGFLVKRRRNQLRKKLGLGKDNLILVSRGGSGYDNKFTIKLLQDLAHIPFHVKILVACGQNKKLKEAVDRFAKAHRKEIISIPFVENFSELLKACDIYICKPGGLSVAEAAFCRVPLITFGAIPGGEEYNVKFIRKHQIGYYSEDSAEVAKEIIRCLGNKSELKKYKQNYRTINHSFSPTLICNEILSRYKTQEGH